MGGLIRFFSHFVGPATVMMAAAMGAGAVATMIRGGAWFRYELLWVVLLMLSGSQVSGAPYFRYRDTFAVGENVWAAMDPGIVMPGQIRKKIELNVVASKTEAQWNASTALAHVAPVGPLQLILQSGAGRISSPTTMSRAWRRMI